MPKEPGGRKAKAKPKPQAKRELPVKLFRTKEAWRAWLEKNHDRSPGVWLRTAKKSSGLKSITYDEALDVALCYGWIDSQGKSFDEKWTMQRWVHRKKGSIWSKRNRDKALALIASGDMRPAGLAEIELAKANGRWAAAYDPPSLAKPPPDLEAALAKNERAKANYAKLDSRNRYAILFRLQTAKKPETRAQRIERFVKALAKGEKLYP